MLLLAFGLETGRGPGMGSMDVQRHTCKGWFRTVNTCSVHTGCAAGHS